MKRSLLHLCARDKDLSLGRTTQIMGIINCTPDSFSGDGLLSFPRKREFSKMACLRYARKLIREGADILDVGGESTRPGASSVSLKEELRRVIPVIEALARNCKVPISVDTSKMEVARQALDAGASIINNIRSAKMSTAFLKMVRDYKAAIVVMHMRGRPSTMQAYTRYKNVLAEVIDELKISVEKCLGGGIKKDRIIVDPGIGFAKTMDQNLVLDTSGVGQIFGLGPEVPLVTNYGAHAIVRPMKDIPSALPIARSMQVANGAKTTGIGVRANVRNH